MGSSNENSAFGPVRNPRAWSVFLEDPAGVQRPQWRRVLQLFRWGPIQADRFGNRRVSGGVVGVTPTYGRVSRYGLMAFASSLDHIGPFGRNVGDAAIDAFGHGGAGRTGFDVGRRSSPRLRGRLEANVKGIRVGLPREYLTDWTSETGDVIDAAIEELRGLGCEVREITLPHTEVRGCLLLRDRDGGSQLQLGALRRRAVYLPFSGLRNLSDMYRFTRGEGFGAEVKRRIMLGTYVLSAGYYDAYYRKAQKVRS